MSGEGEAESITSSASPWPDVWLGMRAALGIPSLMLMASLVGVGGLCRDVGWPLGAGMFSTVLIWAAPGQLVFFGSLAAGASLPAVALAISLSSIRFVPMCMAILPLLRGSKTPIWQQMLLMHYVAVTAWVEGMRRLPGLEKHRRIPYFLGFANTVMAAATLATGAGYYLIGALPPPLAAALLFTSPIYFTVAWVAGARRAIDWLAGGLGFAIAPFVFSVVPPGLDLLVEGLVAGTLAYLVHRFLARKKAAP